MAEKRGHTEKITYDFNTSGVLEIFLKGEWRRTTSREFRSFDGKRRITEPTRTELGNVVVPMRTYDYDGPVYMFGTNKEVIKNNDGTMVTSAYWDNNRKATEKRGV